MEDRVARVHLVAPVVVGAGGDVGYGLLPGELPEGAADIGVLEDGEQAAGVQLVRLHLQHGDHVEGGQVLRVDVLRDVPHESVRIRPSPIAISLEQLLEDRSEQGPVVAHLPTPHPFFERNPLLGEAGYCGRQRVHPLAHVVQQFQVVGSEVVDDEHKPLRHWNARSRGEEEVVNHVAIGRPARQREPVPACCHTCITAIGALLRLSADFTPELSAELPNSPPSAYISSDCAVTPTHAQAHDKKHSRSISPHVRGLGTLKPNTQETSLWASHRLERAAFARLFSALTDMWQHVLIAAVDVTNVKALASPTKIEVGGVNQNPSISQMLRAPSQGTLLSPMAR
eukprot:1188698-Prorocentrum_minimum.AAC.2